MRTIVFVIGTYYVYNIMRHESSYIGYFRLFFWYGRYNNIIVPPVKFYERQTTIHAADGTEPNAIVSDILLYRTMDEINKWKSDRLR